MLPEPGTTVVRPIRGRPGGVLVLDFSCTRKWLFDDRVYPFLVRFFKVTYYSSPAKAGMLTYRLQYLVGMLHLNLNYPLPVLPPPFKSRPSLSLARLYMSITEPHMRSPYACSCRSLKQQRRVQKHPFHEHGRWLQKDNIWHHREPSGERLLIVGPEKHSRCQRRWRP